MNSKERILARDKNTNRRRKGRQKYPKASEKSQGQNKGRRRARRIMYGVGIREI